MADFSDLIQKTFRRLDPYGLTETLQLNGAIEAGAGSIAVSDPSGTILPSLQPGQTLGIDLEIFFVLNVSASTVSVVPGYQGSTEAAHADDALVYLNPRFSLFDIGTAINDDLSDLSSPDNGLFAVNTLEITYNPAIAGYDMTDVNSGRPVTSINEILNVRYKEPFPIGKWKPMPYGSWELVPQSDPIAFPSGYAFMIYRDAFPGLPMRITYSQPFTPFVNLTDSAQSVAGLATTMNDLPPLGAMVALVAPREVRRNQIDSEPDSRRAPEVPAGSVMNSVAGVLRLRQARINAESTRLQQQYGEMRV